MSIRSRSSSRRSWRGSGLGNVACGKLADRLGLRIELEGFRGRRGRDRYLRFLQQVPVLRRALLAAAAARATTSSSPRSCCFSSLLVPTCLMGVSLPLLSRALTHHVGDAGRIIGSLYGWNTLGAAAGAVHDNVDPDSEYRARGRLAMGRREQRALRDRRLRHRGAAPGTTMRRPWQRQAVDRRGHAFPTLPFSSWILVYALTAPDRARLRDHVVPPTWRGPKIHGVHLRHGARRVSRGARIRRRDRICDSCIAASRPGCAFLLLQFALIWYAAVSIALSMSAIGRGTPQGW